MKFLIAENIEVELLKIRPNIVLMLGRIKWEIKLLWVTN